jgi:uncharacterized protein (TIGR00266 family)
MYMDYPIQMETIFGDGSAKSSGGGFMNKLVGAGKRVITGESLFMTAFTNGGAGKRSACFAAPYAGKIVPLDLSEHGEKIICQKDAFLCCAKGISIGIEFQKKIGVGFFGGEGFIMQKLEGDGMAFVHSGGTLAKKVLGANDVLKVDTGCIVGVTKEVDYDIEFIGGIKNSLFGGEGLFYATLRGPGIVYVQSLPFSRLADRIIASAPQSGGESRGEGSLLGGIGRMLDGDNRF